MDRFYEGQNVSDAEHDRRNEISIQPYEALGAPRVGHDDEANAWLLASRTGNDTRSDAEMIADDFGYHAIELLRGKVDGVPIYTHDGLYDGVDATSFRGAFLEECTLFLDKRMLATAWTDAMSPDEAVRYGRGLLAVAEGRPRTRSFLWLFRRSAAEEDTDVTEQRRILEAAGRWYIFWGERGFPIAAYY